ncbi:uncharacterized protein DUF4830 [Paenibacillus taihuensis]|uniref:Uncharacterized protein DUF4830 n=1 Tax=Paenibacillus taihuensis TaxID=1156355 RepID=A0A3D9RZ27_9BACL|nr:DUF4830 domain-containing protein [Paenibacillus taihuensis]REE85318.1 uncharacterized protein DUF4830 [Paenibacillus taihuensis]
MRNAFAMLLVIVLSCLAIGCKSNEADAVVEHFPAAHKQFIEQYGWTIRQFQFEMNYGKGGLGAAAMDRVKELKAKVQLDLNPYINKNVIETEYILNESLQNYNEVSCYLFESEGKVIGGYLALNTSVLKDDVYMITTGPIVPMMSQKEAYKKVILLQ